jgi:hypothetical protein
VILPVPTILKLLAVGDCGPPVFPVIVRIAFAAELAWNVGSDPTPLEVRTNPDVDGEMLVMELLTLPTRTLWMVMGDAVIGTVPFPESTPVNVVAPVPPPATLAVEKVGLEPAPLETRGTPVVAVGGIEVRVFPAPPTRALNCVIGLNELFLQT